LLWQYTAIVAPLFKAVPASETISVERADAVDFKHHIAAKNGPSNTESCWTQGAAS
jgi:hypothetical protein